MFEPVDTFLFDDFIGLLRSKSNPSEKVQRMLEQIAFSEGLFWRKPELAEENK